MGHENVLKLCYDGDGKKVEKLRAWCGGGVSRQVEAEKSGK